MANSQSFSRGVGFAAVVIAALFLAACAKTPGSEPGGLGVGVGAGAAAAARRVPVRASPDAGVFRAP